MTEVKLTPVPRDSVPGLRRERPHDEWAREAISAFIESGAEAAELEVPDFKVSRQTAISVLRQHGVPKKVRVRSVKADTPPTHFRTFLYKEER